jgi:hypothetical protein
MTGLSNSYNWKRYLDGREQVMRRGVHFHGSVAAQSVRMAAINWAHRRKLWITTSVPDPDTVIVRKLGTLKERDAEKKARDGMIRKAEKNEKDGLMAAKRGGNAQDHDEDFTEVRHPHNGMNSERDIPRFGSDENL